MQGQATWIRKVEIKMKKSVKVAAVILGLGAIALGGGYVVNKLALGQADDYDAYEKYNS